VAIRSYLRDIISRKGAGYVVLIDPDRLNRTDIIALAKAAEAEDVDALFIGTSILLSADMDIIVQEIKAVTQKPVILFPGSTIQVSRYADAILFMSLISGRNPVYLIDEQVKAAPLIKGMGLEPISTGYMLVESGGGVKSAEYMSNTRPIPRDKNDIAKATALAAEYLGMEMIYLEAGSGASCAIPVEMVAAVSSYTSLPLIVGGGIRSPQQAADRVKAGASLIVTGNVLESSFSPALLGEFADAIHSGKQPE